MRYFTIIIQLIAFATAFFAKKKKNYFQLSTKISVCRSPNFLNWINVSFKILKSILWIGETILFKNSFRKKLLSLLLLLLFFFFISIHKILRNVNFSHFTKTVFPRFSISYPIYDIEILAFRHCTIYIFPR